MAERPNRAAVRGSAGHRRASAAAPASARHLRLLEPPRRRPAAEAKRLARHDLALLAGATGFLTVMGLTMVLSAGSVSAAQGYGGNSFWYFERQVMYAVVGVIAAVVVARMRPSVWKVAGLPVLLAAIALMAVAARPSSGTALYGASR